LKAHTLFTFLFAFFLFSLPFPFWHSQSSANSFESETAEGDEENDNDNNSASPATITLRVLISAPACGMVIGRGGATIKNIAEVSGARVQLSQKDEMASIVTNERSLSISSTDPESVITCVLMIVETLDENPEQSRYINMTTSYSRAIASSFTNSRTNNNNRGNNNNRNNNNNNNNNGGNRGRNNSNDNNDNSGYTPQFQAFTPTARGGRSRANPEEDGPEESLEVQVPSNMIGAILGKGGSTIHEMQSFSGARIKVSSRDELVPGTNNRLVTVSGSANACNSAQFLLKQKLDQAAENNANGGYRNNSNNRNNNRDGGDNRRDNRRRGDSEENDNGNDANED
jgi:predicted RNA-binding protein YlqC (UPF0109 family)